MTALKCSKFLLSDFEIKSSINARNIRSITNKHLNLLKYSTSVDKNQLNFKNQKFGLTCLQYRSKFGIP